jgi:hypothetical protein
MTMRTTIACILLILSVTVVSQAQKLSDVFNEETEITWLGLDFSEMKVIGDKENWGDKSPVEMYEAWNQLMINESSKYDIAKALRRDRVKMAVSIAMEHNNNLRLNDADVFKIEPSPSYFLNTENIKKIVASYDFRDNKGIGFMMIMESFDKTATTGKMWATFINLNTKEVLFVQQMAARSGGFGLRNYWASCVHDVLGQIQGTEYRKWYKTYRDKK